MNQRAPPSGEVVLLEDCHFKAGLCKPGGGPNTADTSTYRQSLAIQQGVDQDNITEPTHNDRGLSTCFLIHFHAVEQLLVLTKHIL